MCSLTTEQRRPEAEAAGPAQAGSTGDEDAGDEHNSPSAMLQRGQAMLERIHATMDDDGAQEAGAVPFSFARDLIVQAIRMTRLAMEVEALVQNGARRAAVD